MKKHLAVMALTVGLVAGTAGPAAAARPDPSSHPSCMATATKLVPLIHGTTVGGHLQDVLVRGRIDDGPSPLTGMSFGEFVSSGTIGVYCGGTL